MTLKTLETERTILRTLKLKDKEDIFEFCKLSNVAEMIGKPPLKSLEHTIEYLKFEMRKQELYAIECKRTSKVIGTIGMRKTSEENIKMLRIELNPIFWGKGYAFEVGKEIIKYAFEDCSVKEVIGGYYSFNKQSKSINKKLGFVYKETIKDIYEYKGEMVDSVVCTMNLEQYMQVSKDRY